MGVGVGVGFGVGVSCSRCTIAVIIGIWSNIVLVRLVVLVVLVALVALAVLAVWIVLWIIRPHELLGRRLQFSCRFIGYLWRLIVVRACIITATLCSTSVLD